jgi:hypothetical protein
MIGPIIQIVCTFDTFLSSLELEAFFVTPDTRFVFRYATNEFNFCIKCILALLKYWIIHFYRSLNEYKELFRYRVIQI